MVFGRFHVERMEFEMVSGRQEVVTGDWQETHFFVLSRQRLL